VSPLEPLEAAAWRAVVATEPENGLVKVRIPKLGGRALFGPCPFTGELGVGDQVLVVFAEEGTPWIVSGPRAAIADASILTSMLAANAATKLHATSGPSSGPTTGSTSDPPTVAVPEMSITADFGGHPLLIAFTGTFSHTATDEARINLWDSTANASIGNSRRETPPAAGKLFSIGVIQDYTPPAGERTIELRWSTAAGTLTASATRRKLVILELRR
jgi:hypothetical protein